MRASAASFSVIVVAVRAYPALNPTHPQLQTVDLTEH